MQNQGSQVDESAQFGRERACQDISLVGIPGRVPHLQDLELRQLAQFGGERAVQPGLCQGSHAPVFKPHAVLLDRPQMGFQDLQHRLVIGSRGGAPGQVQAVGQVAEFRPCGMVQVAHGAVRL